MLTGGGGTEKCSVLFRWKSTQHQEPVRCCEEAGNLSDVTLAWRDDCLQDFLWKVKVMKGLLFQPAWMTLWRVFWKMKNIHVSERFPKASSNSWRSISVDGGKCLLKSGLFSSKQKEKWDSKRKSSIAICGWTQCFSCSFFCHVGITTCPGPVHFVF